MKNTTYKKRFLDQPYVPYPNAATRRQLLDKFVETLLVIAIGAALGALFLFAMALS